MKYNLKAISVIFAALLLTTLTSAIDINSSESLQYYNSGNLEFQVDGNGNADVLGNLDVNGNAILNSDTGSWTKIETGDSSNAPNGFMVKDPSGESLFLVHPNANVEIPNGNLNVDGNSITNYFGSPCSSGQAVADVNNNGNFNCIDLANQVSDTYVSRAGDSMTGELDMRSNSLSFDGAGGTGDFNLRPASNAGHGVSVRMEANVNAGENIFTVEPSGGSTRFGVQQSTGTWANDGFYVGNYDNSEARANANYYLDGSGNLRANSIDTTGSIDMSSNQISSVGSGNIQLGDGAGDLNMNGNQIYGSSLSQSNFVGVTSRSTAETEKSNMQDYSAYIQNDLKVGGDIIGSGGDVAENVENQTEMEPGTVATISGKFEVKPSSEKHDTGVAGVVSTDPGVTLKKDRDGVPLALSGIVPVKATVENGDISPGDLLTTSDREGYAMKCGDSLECHGAVIGKAMGSLDKTGKVQMLVTLG